jgi:epoxyqueuosine reductase
MTKHELTDLIKREALAIGFTKVGVTTAKPFNEDADRFSAWVAGGAHGMMKWLEQGHDKRRDARNILPGAKSILSLALNYYHAQNIPENSNSKISRYAWGTDYHEIIPGMLRQLLAKIKEIVPEAEGRYYCDTGPLLEKAIAERAGVGWRGKHTNVITRELGSWVFLAEIILNIELDPDRPAEDMCGTCTRCIDACPTDALTPYQLDSRKCISYLTIELKPQNEIPAKLAAKMSGWIYGCDICQDVCPWNRFAEPTAIPEFAPRDEILTLTPESIERMEQEEFSNIFRKSPIKRTKLAGLKRNVRALKKLPD